MPETETPEQPQAPTETEEATSTTETETDPAAELEKWKALARKNEEQAKKNATAAQKLAELEDAQKSEQDKLNDRLSELESTAKSSSTEAARLRVALRKGLTEAQAKRLVGETVEELEEDADELLASFKTDEEPAGVSRSPKERLRPGATPSAQPEKSPDELADAVLKRQRGY